ncbi:MAG: DUF4870 domain-containing protein [Microbacterium sp.]
MPPLPDPAVQPTPPFPPPTAPSVPAYAPPPTGCKSWALGFLACIPIPWLNTLVAGIVMAAVYPSTRRKGVPVATENARIAANWGLTYILGMVLCIVYMVATGVIAPQSVRAGAGFLPIGWGVIAYMVFWVVHLVVTIMGTVIAAHGRVFRNALAIPFIRAKGY